MKFLKPSVEIIPQEPTLIGAFKQIELAGRTCYKSEDKITEDSYKEFYERMVKSGHTAMLEHGTAYLTVPRDVRKIDDMLYIDMFPDNNPWVKINSTPHADYITTNLRFLQERGYLEGMQDFITPPTNFHERRVSVRFVCDRGVSHELVRHRVFSFAQESTRYCNYSKDKFGNELTYIIPDKESWKGLDAYYQMLNCLDEIERVYMKALEEGVTPQVARAILPNCIKTEVVMTGFVSDWEHFFELRCAQNAHPDMRKLAVQCQELFKNNELI
jgi:thymidylate synthase (FAD)